MFAERVSMRFRVRDASASIGDVSASIGDASASIGDTTAADNCGKEGKRSLECSGNGGPDKCCPGLVCHRYQTWRCVKDEKKECSDEGTYATECGSSYEEASLSCCTGLVCGTDAMEMKCVSSL